MYGSNGSQSGGRGPPKGHLTGPRDHEQSGEEIRGKCPTSLICSVISFYEENSGLKLECLPKSDL